MKYWGTDKGRSKIGYWKYLKELRSLAKNNRNRPTEAEEIVWEVVRKRYLGYKFTRQKPIDRFIVDFYCSKLLLVIEVDGGIHTNSIERDLARDSILKAMGILTVRFDNDEVLKEKNKFSEKINKIILERSKEFGVLPLIKGRTIEERGLL